MEPALRIGLVLARGMRLALVIPTNERRHTMLDQPLICDECRRPLMAPEAAWEPPSDVVLLCKECSRTSGPAPASGLTPCVLEVESGTQQHAAAAG